MRRMLPNCGRFTTVVLVALALGGLAHAQHTIDDLHPFHLAPGDYFTIELGSAVLVAASVVDVELTPVGPGSVVTATVELKESTGVVGARLPNAAGIPVGQYTCSVTLDGTPNIGANPSVWVRELDLKFVRRTAASATFEDPPLPGALSATSVDFKEADFVDLNHDGTLDVYSANSHSGDDVDGMYINQVFEAASACSKLFCEDITARVTRQSGVSSNRTYDADFADIDLDGDLDLIRSDNSSSFPLRFFLNDGTGNFVERTEDDGAIVGLAPSLSGIASNTAEIDIGDVNGDGFPDILTASWGGSRIGLVLNRISTTGRFEAVDYDCGGPSPHALCDTDSSSNRGAAFGDFNADGLLDILAVDYNGNSHVVYLNTGNDGSGVPQFSAETGWVQDETGALLTITAGDLKVADLDGDGDADVAIASPGQSPGADKGVILWNDGGTRLVEVASSKYPMIGDTYDVAFSDVDGDGDLDVLFATEFDHATNNIILLNRGGTDGNMVFEALTDVWYEEQPFGDPIADPAPNFDLSVSTGDYDLDGDRDLLGAGFSGKIGLWENTLFSDGGESRDWIFVLDRTRSMIKAPSGSDPGYDFFEPAKNVLMAFLAQRNTGDQVALVTYDYTGSDSSDNCAPDTEGGIDVKALKEFELGVLDAAALSTHVDGLVIGTCTGWCTSIGAALRAAIEVAALGSPDREKVIVLATDGRNNQCPPPEDIVPTIPSGVSVYVVALGTGTDDGALAALATNEGKFYVAGRSDDYVSVQGALRDIDVDLEAHATGKQVLTPVSSAILRGWLTAIQTPDIFLRDRRGLLDDDVPDVADVRRVHYFAVDPADREVRFTLSWRNINKATRMKVTDPAGRSHPIAGDAQSTERTLDKAHVVSVGDPLSGIWTVEEVIVGNPGTTKVTGLASSALEFTADTDLPRAYLGADLRIIADLSVRGQAVATSQVTASFLSPSENPIAIAGERLDESRWSFMLPAVAEAGTWRVTLTAAGTARRPFVRTWHEAIYVRTPQPGDPDLENISIVLDRTTLTAGGSDDATITLKLVRRDGAPLVGAGVSFASELGEPFGPVLDHGDGSYSQQMRALSWTGTGSVLPRIGAERLRDAAAFEVVAGPVDDRASGVDVIVGPLLLCADQGGEYDTVVMPVDALGNPLVDAAVEIEASGGPLTWTGPVSSLVPGRYVRTFEGPSDPGMYAFHARVDGVALSDSPVLEVFESGTPEALLVGCGVPAGPTVPPAEQGWPWWCWLIVLLVVLLILFLVKKVF